MKSLTNVDVIAETDRKILHELRDLLRQLGVAATIIFYGSRARGTHTDESDFDVLLLTDTKLSRQEEDRVDSAAYDLQLEHGVLIALTILPRDVWNSHPNLPFRRDIETYAIEL